MRYSPGETVRTRCPSWQIGVGTLIALLAVVGEGVVIEDGGENWFGENGERIDGGHGGVILILITEGGDDGDDDGDGGDVED